MRPRLFVTKRIEDGLYVGASFRPNLGRPSAGGLLLAFAIGALLFIVFGLAFIAMFAP